MVVYKLNHSWHYTPSFIYEYNYSKHSYPPCTYHLTQLLAYILINYNAHSCTQFTSQLLAPKVHHLTCKVLFSHFIPLHNFYMPRFHLLPLQNPSRDKPMSLLAPALLPSGNPRCHQVVYKNYGFCPDRSRTNHDSNIPLTAHHHIDIKF